MDLETIGAGLNLATVFDSFLPKGAGNIIVSLLLLGGLITFLKLNDINRSTKGLLTNIVEAKKTGKTLVLMPIEGGLLNSALMPSELKDGKYTLGKLSWTITEAGKGLLLPGVEYTVLVENIGTNMTITQMASMIIKGAYVVSHYPNKEDVEKNPTRYDVNLFNEVVKQLQQFTYIPSAAAVESAIMKAANMQLPKLMANKNRTESMIFWIIVLIIVFIGGYFLITSKPPTEIRISLDQAKALASYTINSTIGGSAIGGVM